MPRPCSVCASPDRERIDAAIVAGESAPAIGKRFRVGADAVLRHGRAHLTAAPDPAEGGELAAKSGAAETATEEAEAPPVVAVAHVAEVPTTDPAPAAALTPVYGAPAGYGPGGIPLMWVTAPDWLRFQREAAAAYRPAFYAGSDFDAQIAAEVRAEHERLLGPEGPIVSEVAAIKTLMARRVALADQAQEARRAVGLLQTEAAELRRRLDRDNPSAPTTGAEWSEGMARLPHVERELAEAEPRWVSIEESIVDLTRQAHTVVHGAILRAADEYHRQQREHLTVSGRERQARSDLSSAVDLLSRLVAEQFGSKPPPRAVVPGRG